MAAAGFLAGYAWAVFRWADRVGLGHGGAAAREFFAIGCPLAAGYGLLLACLFAPWLAPPREISLRMAVAPTAFTLSALLGAVCMEVALRLIG